MLVRDRVALVIIVELTAEIAMYPGGRERHAQHMGTLTITNDQTHPSHPEMGSYTIRVHGPGSGNLLRQAKIRNFPRKESNGWDLVKKALTVIVDDEGHQS